MSVNFVTFVWPNITAVAPSKYEPEISNCGLVDGSLNGPDGN